MSLDTCLRDQDFKLYSFYLDIKARARDEFQKHMTLIEGQLTDHGIRHHEKVEENANRLLPSEMKKKMQADEIFVLLCAVQFHDVGLLYNVPEGEPLRVRRRKHPDRTYEFLRDKYAEWGLEEAYAIPIADICRRHSGKRLYDPTKEEYYIRNSVIDPIFFGSVLRLADELDIGFERISRTILDMGIVKTPESLKHHLKEGAIAGVHIEPQSWSIKIDALPKTTDGEEILNKYVKLKVQEELDYMEPALQRGNLYYNSGKVTLYFVDFELLESWERRIAKKLEDIFLTKKEPERPYRFLDYYDLESRHCFYGRERDIRRFYGHITSHKITSIYGDSGIGKTSLIKAGLMPRLIQNGKVPVYVQCLSEPGELIKTYAVNITSKLEEIDATELQKLNLRDFFNKLYEQLGYAYEFYVFIDQFEQFFEQLEQGSRQSFVEQLASCVSDDGLNTHFVFALREEYLPRLGEYDLWVRDFVKNASLLEMLSREEMEEAIAEPVKKFGLEYEPGLVAEIIDDICQEEAFNTPQIQIVCDRLYDVTQEKANKTIAMETYEELGRTQGILGRFLEQEINKFEFSEREDVKSVLKTLVDPEQTKTALPAETIASYTRLGSGQVEDILQKLEDRSRLVRRLFVNGITLFELAHEFLVPKIHEWLEEPDRELIRTRKMVQVRFGEWRNRQGDTTYLIRKDLLGEIPPLRLALGLPDEQRQYVLESYLWNDPMNEVEIWFWINELEPKTVAGILIKVLQAKSTLEDDRGYKETLTTLKKLGMPVVKDIVEALATSNWRVRQGLISALIAIGEPCVPLLTEALHSDNRKIRLGASSAVESLGHML